MSRLSSCLVEALQCCSALVASVVAVAAQAEKGSPAALLSAVSAVACAAAVRRWLSMLADFCFCIHVPRLQSEELSIVHSESDSLDA